MATTDYSLRAKKHARTKIALTQAFIERLRHARFEDISIRDVCRSAEISEGTFFNYFPGKLDVITYYVHLMILRIIWKARKQAPRGSPVGLVNAFFEELANEFATIDIRYEIVSIMVAQRERTKKVVISGIERNLFFPDLDGIEDIRILFIDDFLRECLEGARKAGELPASVPIDNTVVSLLTLMIGTMIAVKFHDVKTIHEHYRRHLKMLWETLGARKKKG